MLPSIQHVTLPIFNAMTLVQVLLFQRIVSQEFFDQVDVGQHHSSAAVSLQLKLIKSITLS